MSNIICLKLSMCTVTGISCFNTQTLIYCISKVFYFYYIIHLSFSGHAFICKESIFALLLFTWTFIVSLKYILVILTIFYTVLKIYNFCFFFFCLLSSKDSVLCHLQFLPSPLHIIHFCL